MRVPKKLGSFVSSSPKDIEQSANVGVRMGLDLANFDQLCEVVILTAIADRG